MSKLCKGFDRGGRVRRRAVRHRRAFAQSSRQIKFIVPFPAGGGGDRADPHGRGADGPGARRRDRDREPARRRDRARHRSRLPRRAGRQHASAIVANSFIIHPNFKKLSYDPLTSFEPVCLLANSPQVIVVNSSSPYKTLTEWLDAARAKPGELSHASVGPASAQHIAFEQLKLLAKVNMTFVPFNGNTPALNALLGGHVGSVMSNYSEAAELVDAGKLRALAVGQRQARLDGMAERADGRRAGLQGLRGRGLVRTGRAGQDAEGQGRRAVEMVRGGDAGAGAQAEMGLAGPRRRSAARPRSSPRICASSRRTTRA